MSNNVGSVVFMSGVVKNAGTVRVAGFFAMLEVVER
jgi:hypothetical protein